MRYRFPRTSQGIIRENPIFIAAGEYLNHGLSVIPIHTDGTKRPVLKWSPYQKRLPNPTEWYSWFRACRKPVGLALVGGAVSGNLAIMDFDEPEIVPRWNGLVETQAPGLLERLVQVRTPTGGLHCYFRTPVPQKTSVLAWKLEDDADGRKTRQTRIELKGEGSYCIAPPSPPGCHPSGQQYCLVSEKSFSDIAHLPEDDVSILLGSARLLNDAAQATARAVRPRRAASMGFRPGDDFSRRITWHEILEPHGWEFVRTLPEGVSYWRRPDKPTGISGTTNYGGSDRLFVFSTNAAPLEPWRAYDKFSVYTILNHSGDYRAAAHNLKSKGYGGMRCFRNHSGLPNYLGIPVLRFYRRRSKAD